MAVNERCDTCGMTWIGQRTEPHLHVCPEALPPDLAEAWQAFYLSTRLPCHPRFAAQIRLGLAQSVDEGRS
jgi:hypothetical protein